MWSGITWPSSAPGQAGYSERAFEPVQQDGIVDNVENDVKIEGDDNGSTPKI